MALGIDGQQQPRAVQLKVNITRSLKCRNCSKHHNGPNRVTVSTLY